MLIENFSLFSILLAIYSAAQEMESYGNYQQPSLIHDNLEFCEAEAFSPECPEHHAVLITRASYGRMKFGKCIKPGYISNWCVKDVLIQMENRCSGKQSCEVRIPDKHLDSKAECPPDLKTYLNVSYICVQVEHDACFMCSKEGEEHALVKYRSGYLASEITKDSTEERKCGTVKCPWKIEVMVGQTINLTLLDFTLDKINLFGQDCVRYAVVKEQPHSNDIGVCGGKNRVRHIYHSVTNSLELQIVSSKVFSLYGQFIFKYEAVGCADLESLPNAKVKRMKDETEVMCDDGQKWVVKCKGNKWVGDYGVCPSAMMEPSSTRYIGALSVGLLTAIVIGIALVIAVFIVTVGVVCLKKHHQDSMHPRGALYVHPSQCYELRGQYQRANYFEDESLSRKYQKSLYPFGYNQSVGGVDRRNVYDVPKNIESRPLPSIPVEPVPVPKMKQVEAKMEAKSHKYQSVIVSTNSSTTYHPTTSNSNNSTYQSQIPAASGSVESGRVAFPNSHYTVLDSAAQQQQFSNRQTNTPSSAGYSDTGALTWAVPDPQSTAYSYASSSQGGSDDGVSSKESGAQSGNKNIASVMTAGAFQSEVYNSQIPLRPMREGSQAAVNANSNNINNLKNGNKVIDQSSNEGTSADKSFSTGTNSWP